MPSQLRRCQHLRSGRRRRKESANGRDAFESPHVYTIIGCPFYSSANDHSPVVSERSYVVHKGILAALAIIGTLLILYFFGGWLWLAVITIFETTIHVIVTVGTAIFSIVVAAFSLVSHLIITIVGIAVVGIVIVGAIAGVAWIAIALAQLISTQLVALGDQLKELKFSLGESAKDGAFLALVATLCSLIAYTGTDDFLNQISSIRFFAASVIGLVAAKLFLFFPWRIAKWCGLFLTFVIIAGSICYVAEHYRFLHSLTGGFMNVGNAALNPNNEVKAVLFGIIAILALLTLLYPFTATAWRRLLSTAEASKV